MSESDSEPDDNFVTPHGSPSNWQPDLPPIVLDNAASDESLDVFADWDHPKQSNQNRRGSYSANDLRRKTEKENATPKHRLGSIDICKSNLMSVPPCTSRSVSLDDGVKNQISETYDVDWSGATRQRGVVLVSDGQKEGEVIQQLDVMGLNEDMIHKDFLRHNYDGIRPHSPVVIHSATNVIQDSLVYLNQPEKEEPASNSREGKFSSLLSVFKQEDKVFVETCAFQEAEEILENYFRVMLTGRPGDGKSAIAKHIIVKKCRQGFRFVLLNGSTDFDSVKFDEKILLFFDDIFGVTVFDRSRTEDIQRILWQLDNILMDKCGDVLMIMTSRAHILQEAMKVLKNPDFVSKVTTDLADHLNDREKMQIMRKHFQFLNLKREESFFEQAIVLSPNHGFPHCVQMFAQSPALRKRGVDFFRSPIEYLMQNLNVMKIAKPLEFAVLVYIALRDGKINRYARKFPNQDGLRMEFIRKMVGVELDLDLAHLLSCKSEELSLFLSDSDNSRIFRHPSIQDAVTFMMGEESTSDIIDVCSFDFISARIRTSQYKCQNNEKIISVQRQHFPIIAQRLVEEIKHGNIRDVCFHQAMTDQEFVSVICKGSTLGKSFKGTRAQAEADLLSYVQFDTIHKFFGSLLYWSSVANTTYLTQTLLQMDGMQLLLEEERDWMQKQLRECFIFTILHGTDVVLARHIGRLVDDKVSQGTTVFTQDILNILKEPLYSQIFSEVSLKLSPLQAATLSIGSAALDIVKYLLPFVKQADILKSSISMAMKLQRQDIVEAFLILTNLSLDREDILCALKNGDFTFVKEYANADVLCLSLKSLNEEDIRAIFEQIDSPVFLEIVSHLEQKELEQIYRRGLPYVKSVEVASKLTQNLTTVDISELSLDIFQNTLNKDVLEFLIAQGANVNISDTEGLTALFLVNDHAILTKLLENGASVNSRESISNRNPLMHHGINGTLSCSLFETFLKYGISMKETCSKGQNLLMQIVSSWNVRKHKEVRKDEQQLLKMIIRETIDFSLCDKQGNNVLHICMLANVPMSVFELILEKKCEINTKNMAGFAPIHLAVSFVYTKSKKKQWRPIMLEHLQYLLRSGAGVNAQNKDGDTILHLVMKSFVDRLNYYDEKLTSYEKLNEESKFTLMNSALDLLLLYNIDLNKRNEERCTAFNLLSKTRSRRCLQIVEKFLHHKAAFGMSEFLTILTICSKHENSNHSWSVMQALREFAFLRWKDLFASSQCARCEEYSCFVKLIENHEATDQTVLGTLKSVSSLQVNTKERILKTVVAVLSDTQQEGLKLVCSSLDHWCKSLDKSEFVSALFFGILAHVLHFFNYRQSSIIRFRDVASMISQDIDVLILMLNHHSEVTGNRQLNLLMNYLESDMDDDTIINSVIPVLLPVNFDMDTEINGTTLLIGALKSSVSRQKLLQFLCDKGADVNKWIGANKKQSPLLTVLINDNKKVQKTLSYDNLYKRFTFITSDKEICGSTQLRLLLRNGLNLRKEHTLFKYVRIEDCCLKSLELLMSSGVAADEADDTGQTLLHKLCSPSNLSETVKKPFNRLDILRLLLSFDCDLNRQDKDGNTPAHLLSMRRHQNGLEEIISKGIDINLQNRKGETCLHLSADNAASVQCLIQYGCDVNLTTNEGCNALHSFFSLSSESKKPKRGLTLAIEKRFQDIQGLRVISLLLDAGIDINARENRGMTVCHMTAYFFDAKWINEIFRLLIRNGANVLLHDNEGKSPIHYVLCRMQKSNQDVVKLLMPALKTLIRHDSKSLEEHRIRSLAEPDKSPELSDLFDDS
ncbi:uncharacterized protein LOC133191202 [Saccostrea echinata]|uniref:uncharacterized protein LOC133177452 n=1 Tax=Saccostrea echinata TaxID=191078 RepID=UPI002A80C400|nr:uncharacterized protein LOC133177452 [Saccostrea echinata]XP_061182921.1 uncharacterized protein LOC133191202 [Saccostrea echinata]